MAASRFATVMKAITTPVTVRSQVLPVDAAQVPGDQYGQQRQQRTAGTTHYGPTRYFAGSATLQKRGDQIASATGHQVLTPRALDRRRAGAAAGWLPARLPIPHCACVSRSPSVRTPLSGRQARPCLS